MKELAELIVKVSEEWDEKWDPINAKPISFYCPATPEGQLVSILLQTAWNDAINWAKEQLK